MEADKLDEIMDFLSGRQQKPSPEDKNRKSIADEDQVTHQAMLNYIELSGDKATGDWLKGVIPKYDDAKPQRKIGYWKWLIPVAAAALVLLLFLPGILKPNLTATQLALDYQQAYDLPFGDRGTAQNALVEAGQYYQIKNYEAAIPLLQKIIEEKPESKYQLALGISYLETNNFSAAIQVLQNLIAKDDPVYKEHAQWYSALGYLHQNDPANAAILLKELAQNPNAFNHSKSKKLLKEKIFATKK